jgi:hypothetical protein
MLYQDNKMSQCQQISLCPINTSCHIVDLSRILQNRNKINVSFDKDTKQSFGDLDLSFNENTKRLHINMPNFPIRSPINQSLHLSNVNILTTTTLRNDDVIGLFFIRNNNELFYKPFLQTTQCIKLMTFECEVVNLTCVKDGHLVIEFEQHAKRKYKYLHFLLQNNVIFMRKNLDFYSNFHKCLHLNIYNGILYAFCSFHIPSKTYSQVHVWNSKTRNIGIITSSDEYDFTNFTCDINNDTGELTLLIPKHGFIHVYQNYLETHFLKSIENNVMLTFKSDSFAMTSSLRLKQNTLHCKYINNTLVTTLVTLDDSKNCFVLMSKSVKEQFKKVCATPHIIQNVKLYCVDGRNTIISFYDKTINNIFVCQEIFKWDIGSAIITVFTLKDFNSYKIIPIENEGVLIITNEVLNFLPICPMIVNIKL